MSTAVAAGLFAGPAFAADVLSYPAAPPPFESPVYSPVSIIAGDVSLAFGYFDYSDTGVQVVSDGRVNIPFGPGWNEELEIGGLSELVDDGYTAIGAFSHTYWKNQQFAAGFVVGASSLDSDGVVTAGVEGAVFMPTTSFLGHLSYSWGNGGIPDFWTINGEARWYWNPNTRLAGSVTYSDWENAWFLVASAEHRFDGTMFSAFTSAGYETDDGGDGWELMAGGRLLFDQPGMTLQGHDHAVPFSTSRIISY